ncbi:DUF1850 domain-containing protein [Sporosarcina limicola]|uniref:RocC n=1 Tax=Sporosarcina limicola TaxID=34101 RepID=A0A927R8E1_9BACL|nr:DUF1850 domain-containing protein [Sporosarcina limicola]MBE1556919.1 hypothetical protein [Sporosarcina limicola]
MTKKNSILLTLVLLLLLALIFFFLPLKQAFIFTEYRTEQPRLFYLPLGDEYGFQIRYVHSIHLSDVIETYEATEEGIIRLLSMQYEDVGIGLPGHAEEGEKLSVKDGLYTLTYDDKVIDSFTMIVGDVDADLAFRYAGNELDLKKQLERGKSYTFAVVKLSIYEMMKGDCLNGKR